MVPLRNASGGSGARGGAGELVALDGEVLLAVLERAVAPGAPLAFDAELAHGPRRVEGKCIESKRRADARFDVRLRVVNLRRDTREALSRALGLVNDS